MDIGALVHADDVDVDAMTDVAPTPSPPTPVVVGTLDDELAALLSVCSRRAADAARGVSIVDDVRAHVVDFVARVHAVEAHNDAVGVGVGVGDADGEQRVTRCARCVDALSVLFNAGDVRGRRVLHTLVVRGDARAARLAIACGASVDALDAHGNTPLSLSACQHHIDVVAMLLESGADARVRDGAGRLPIDWTRSRLRVLRLHAASARSSVASASASASASSLSLRALREQLVSITTLFSHYAAAHGDVESARRLAVVVDVVERQRDHHNTDADHNNADADNNNADADSSAVDALAAVLDELCL